MAGRPRSFDREQALDVAVEQFWRHGYDGTTVSTLTRAMAIAPPSLYAAFGDKDRLFAEAAQCYGTRIRAGLEVALDQPTARAGIAELLRITAEAHTDSATPPGCFVLTEPRLAEAREALREQIAARIGRGLSDGDLPPDTDAQHLASFLIAVLAGMSERARDGGNADEVKAIAELALRAVPQALPGTTSPL